MNSDQELAHRLKIKFGTSPYEPTSYQLEAIKRDVLALAQKGITPTISDWASIVKKHCPSAGTHGYCGADTSDLITLMKLATKK
jgi:hypothetical protein